MHLPHRAFYSPFAKLMSCGIMMSCCQGKRFSYACKTCPHVVATGHTYPLVSADRQTDTQTWPMLLPRLLTWEVIMCFNFNSFNVEYHTEVLFTSL